MSMKSVGVDTDKNTQLQVKWPVDKFNPQFKVFLASIQRQPKLLISYQVYYSLHQINLKLGTIYKTLTKQTNSFDF